MAALLLAAATGCGPGSAPASVPSGAQAVPAGSAAADAGGSPSTPEPPRVRVEGVIATGLTSPWGLVFLPDGSALVSERDTAQVKRVHPDGSVEPVGAVPGVLPGGEGGLLGLAIPPGSDPDYVLAYATTGADNRVLRLEWAGGRLGSAVPVLTGIPRGPIHNGGRLAFGPDGAVYVATGEVGEPDRAQDPADLGGKVLRVTPEGRPAPGNPTAGSPVFTLGHRNVQGLAFDATGRLWASEFGAKDVDELNLLVAGANYGWPVHEGAAGAQGYQDPMAQWSPTSLASPSGIAVLGDAVYVASLRGERLWQVPLVGTRTGTPIALDLGDLGRLRTIAAAPDGSLWLATSNTDGRGAPREGDDRILRLVVG